MLTTCASAGYLSVSRFRRASIGYLSLYVKPPAHFFTRPYQLFI
jgi:hypothetical protein